MTNFPKKLHAKLKLYTLLTFILIILVAIHLLPKPTIPQITSTLPQPNATNISLFSPILLTFSQPVKLEDVTITTSPTDNFTPSQPQSNSIQFDHQLAFRQSTTYTTKVYYQHKLIYSFQFTTQKSQNDPRQIQLLEQKTKLDYPLADFTPYATDQFEIIYISPKTLQITLKKPNLDRNKILDQVKFWLETHGQDPNSHQFVFKQLTPYHSTI